MASEHTNNYRKRLFAVFAIFTWVITIAFFAVQYTREREYKIDLLNTRLQEVNARVIADMADGETIDKPYTESLGIDSLRLSIISADGRVLFDSNTDSVKANHRGRKEVADALSTGRGYTVRRQSETEQSDYFYSATRAGDVVVRTALPYNRYLISALTINSLYGYVIALVACIITMFALFASKRISLNVEMLRDFADRAEKGDLRDFRSDDFPKNELGEISGHIVNLYKNLKQTTEERDRHLKEAMFEESEKNRIKQQLTNNINHELKTPVHAIQACLETVVNNEDKLTPAQRRELLDQSYQNVRRLSALLADVSTLTRMSEAPDKIEKEEVNVKSLVDMLLADLRAAYFANGEFSVFTNIPDNATLRGNVALLESIFKNLIVNSVLHSGGNEIHLSCFPGSDGFLHCSYWDNGSGVPAEHLDKIFERFYRIDGGRSRANGGTGLGLAIARNAVAFHGGEITASNREPHGLRFDFTLRE